MDTSHTICVNKKHELYQGTSKWAIIGVPEIAMLWTVHRGPRRDNNCCLEGSNDRFLLECGDSQKWYTISLDIFAVL